MRVSSSLRLLGITAFSLGATYLLPSTAEAQTMAIRQPVRTEQSQVLIQLFSKGMYDEMIALSNRWIEGAVNQGVAPDPYVFYWRGQAEYRLGWFAQAKRDMALAIQTGAQIAGESPQVVIARIQAMETALPSAMKEIKQGDRTNFRVHYSPDDPVAKIILKALPDAYRVNSTMYGTDVSNQLILIFETQEQLEIYMRAHGSAQMPRDIPAFADGSILVFCSWKLEDSVTQSIAGLVTHEYNHSVLTRVLGNVEMPNWFVEGIAEYARAQIDTQAQAQNDRQIARLVETNSLVLPQRLEKYDSFHQQTNLGIERGLAGEKRAASPYAQGYHMTRFLLSNIEKDGLPTFLNKARETGSFSLALQTMYDLTLPQFYDLWNQDMKKQLKEN